MFNSAFAKIFQNFGMALKVTIVPFIILIAMIAGMGGIFYTNFTFSDTAGPQYVLLMFFLGLLCFVVALILFAWTAISWHRGIIMGEPVGFIPSLKGLPIGPYIGNSILIGLILLIPAIAVFFLVGLIVSSLLASMATADFVLFTIISTVVGAIAGIFIQFLWLRMAIVLPSIAVNRAIGIGDGWAATGPISGSIFWVSVIMSVITTGVTLVLLPLQTMAPLLAGIAQIPFNFLIFVFGISILTETYQRVYPTDNVADVFE